MEVTLIPVPTFAEAKVPVPVSVTTSPDSTPLNVPVMVALVLPSYVFVVTAGEVIASALAVISAVNPVG